MHGCFQGIPDWGDSANLIFDVHEHHRSELFLSRQVQLHTLFEQSYAGWTLKRPYPLPHETWEEREMEAFAAPCRWEDVKPFLEKRGSNHFVRNLIKGILMIHGQEGDEFIDASNWERINHRIIESRKDPGFQADWLARVGIGRVITDDYAQPTVDVRPILGKGYASVMRINAFCLSHHPSVRDHNGNNGIELLERAGLHPNSFDDYLDALRVLVSSMASRGQIAFKHALAYDRDLAVAPADSRVAAQVWGKQNPSPEEVSVFADTMTHFFCQLASEMDLPFQVHLGTAWIRGSHPMRLASLVEAHPDTRFLMMHLAYPWSRDLLGMAFVYRNLWIDLTWSWLLSPSHFKWALHEAVEILPDEHRMMLGGDTWHVEETCATMTRFRELFSEVMDEKIRDRYFSARDAERLQRRVYHRNAIEFFRWGE